MVYKVVNGAIPSGDEWMVNSNVVLRQSCRGLVRALQDRSVVFSADGGEWGEEYSTYAENTIGRLASVNRNSAENTAIRIYNDDKYFPSCTDSSSGDSDHSDGGWANLANAYDGNDSTAATQTLNGASYYVGKTFSAKTISTVAVLYSKTTGAGTYSIPMKIQTYDGSTWSDVDTVDSPTTSGSPSQTSGHKRWIGAVINSSIQGVRVEITQPGIANDFYIYRFIYGEPTESVIVHDLPSGSFSSTIISAYGSALVEDWEDGANIQYKLTNAGEDTGWLDYNEVSTFTAFTSEPTKCIVKLVPKSSSPTAGYPSINGFCVIE